MQRANVMLALGGDRGNTIPKYEVTPAEVAVLRTLHGEDAVFDIEPLADVERTNRAERDRLETYYGRSMYDNGNGGRTPVLNLLFPGIGARLFETFDELDLPEDFYKATGRMKPPAPAAEKHARGKKAKGKADAEPEAEKPAEGEQETDGVEDMDDQTELFG